MLKAQELARLQRAIDGLSSPDDSEHSSPCDFFVEPVENQERLPEGVAPENPSQNGSKTAEGNGLPSVMEGRSEGAYKENNETRATALSQAAEEDEEFNIHLLLKQGRRQRLQRQQQQNDDKEQPVSLPSVEVALEEAACRVRQRQAHREEEAAARAALLAGDEVQHVSASGLGGGGSRRPAKKHQQVYVGLPVGVGWHVPLVGVEGRGGYKPAPQGEREEEGEKKASTAGQKRSLTVKEREKLKRKKGQSSHATWKPETWMQLRQQYD